MGSPQLVDEDLAWACAARTLCTLDVAVDPLSLSTIARLGLSDRHGQQACALGCAECTPIRSRPRGPPVWSPEAEKGGVSIRFRVCRLPTVFDFYIVTKERACHSLLATQTRASRAGLALTL